jgi:hypothetical protein
VTLGLYQVRQALARVGGPPSAPAHGRSRKERCELISETKTKPLPCIIGSFHGVRKDSFILQHTDNLVYMMLYFKIKRYDNSTTVPVIMLKDNAQELLCSVESSCH